MSLTTCTRCELSHTRSRVVIGGGASPARLLVIGEAPGRTEDEGGEPFIGRSGQLLFALLSEKTGVSRDECFITNVVKCRPPHNRTPHRREIDACAPWLSQQLRDLHYGAVLTVGLTAARAVYGTTSPLRDIRHTTFTVLGRPGWATFHPAAALRSRTTREMLGQDLEALGRVL
jgi:DNA polymerase